MHFTDQSKKMRVKQLWNYLKTSVQNSTLHLVLMSITPLVVANMAAWSLQMLCIHWTGWTRAWIKDRPEHNGKLIHPLSTEQYDLLIKMMYDNNLSISIKFESVCNDECGGNYESYDMGSFTSDGNKLIYTTLSSVDQTHTFKDYGKATLDRAVDFFMSFVEDADESKIRKWVKKTVPPDKIFEYYDEEILKIGFAFWEAIIHSKRDSTG